MRKAFFVAILFGVSGILTSAQSSGEASDQHTLRSDVYLGSV